MLNQRPGPATIALLALFGLSFVAQLIGESAYGFSLTSLLALTYQLDVSLAWRWITYPLVEAPGDTLGRLIGMVIGYLMLSQHERAHGARSTLTVVLAGIVGAGVLCFPFGALGVGSPLVGMGPVIWAPLGMMLAIAGDRPVMLLSWVLPNAKVAAGILLLLPAASALFRHDPTPLLEAVGGAAGGFLVAIAPSRMGRPTPTKKKPARKHGFQVIQGGGQGSPDRDDDPPKWLN